MDFFTCHRCGEIMKDDTFQCDWCAARAVCAVCIKMAVEEDGEFYSARKSPVVMERTLHVCQNSMGKFQRGDGRVLRALPWLTH